MNTFRSPPPCVAPMERGGKQMAEKTESSARVEIGLRAAIIAKAALEMLGMEPPICRLQIKEVEDRVTEMKAFLKSL